MEFALTDEQAMIAETAREFFAENATSERTRAAMASDGIDRDLWAAFCGELGLGGLLIAEDHGGAGLGMVEFASVAEAAGAQVAPLPLLGLAAAGTAIASGGSAAQQTRWLPRLASGKVIATSGSSPELIVSDNRLSGTVPFLPHGHAADIFLLSDSMGVWIVEADAGGIAISTPTTMDQTRPLATVTLENVTGDPLENSKAGLDAGHAVGWLCLTAEALGGAQACLDRTINYAKDRIQFGRPIGSFQAYKHRLADMMIEIEQARSAVYWAACAIDEDIDDPELALHAAKSFCADTYFQCAADMIQLHGGIGFTWEHDAHLFFKRARSIQTMMRDGDWHREQVAAMVLGDAA
ncbi:MAG: acyl-CoA dehydrogenase family protein [Pseudomonadota bacterium]